MKRFTFFVCIAVLLLLVPASVSAVYVLGNISITSSPSGAAIFFDGERVGSETTPSNVRYPVGNHEVMLRLSGYDEYNTTVTVIENSTVSINHEFQNTELTISGISPSIGFNTSTLYGVTISGSGFSASGVSVVLTKAGETDITGICSFVSTTTMTCSFPLRGETAGKWNVVVKNAGGSDPLINEFTIKSSTNIPTLTSITPSSGRTNTTVTITSFTGTNFASDAYMKLERTNYNPILGDVTSVNTAGTKIVGTFDLGYQAAGNYEVCVYNDATSYTCDLTFTITDPDAGTDSSVYFDTNPPGASVWLDNERVGTSVFTYYNATPGTYDVLLRKTGYKDYAGTVTVLEGRHVTFYARLTAVGDGSATTATTAKTATTIKKSTIPVPTAWPSDAPTEASPVDPAVVIAAAGIALGFVVIRRR
jgi:hypothetical protein